MIIRLTDPYIDYSLSTPPTLEGVEYNAIMDSVFTYLVKAEFLSIKKDETTFLFQLENILYPEEYHIANRLFSANFYKVFDASGKANYDILEQFADQDTHECISWFIKMGDLLKVKFGIEKMEAMANRLFRAYFPNNFETNSWFSKKSSSDLTLFGQELWPLFLAHHAVKSVFYGETGSISK